MSTLRLHVRGCPARPRRGMSRSRHGMRGRQSGSASRRREEGWIGRLGHGRRGQGHDADRKHTGKHGGTDHFRWPPAGFRIGIFRRSRQMVLEDGPQRHSVSTRAAPRRDGTGSPRDQIGPIVSPWRTSRPAAFRHHGAPTRSLAAMLSVTPTHRRSCTSTPGTTKPRLCRQRC
jgi:hypothetical protein